MSATDDGPQTSTPTEEVADAPPQDGAEESAAEDLALTVAPEVVANNLSEYLTAWGRRLRNGESGMVPVLFGLIAIVIAFQVENSKFLSNGNLVNLFVEAALYVMFGAAEFFVLVLSEIDLSAGFTAAVCGFVIAELMTSPVNLPWWVAVIGGLVVGLMIGALQGTLVTRLGLPSFVVTLGGFLAFQGVMLELATIDKTAVGGVVSVSSDSPVYKLVNANMSTTLGWIVLIVALGLFAAVTLLSVTRRRAKGLTAPPISVALLTIGIAAVVGVALVLICNANRGAFVIAVRGVPWVIPFVLLVLLIYSLLMGKTRLGRYMYAIGNNPEAARRAGINVAVIRTLGFMLCSMTAALAGLIYMSQLGSISTDFDGGTYVLFAVAAAVIGGTSLFGGRGKPVHSLLGGVLIAVVYNGLELLSVSTAIQDIATAGVLIAAVSVDALVRRRSATLR
jgi:D-xylose transport system permease protein